jgi:hypothetical protein
MRTFLHLSLNREEDKIGDIELDPTVTTLYYKSTIFFQGVPQNSLHSFIMRCLFLLVFLSLKAYGFLNTSPLYGSAYVLYCIEPAVSSYFYVAWTDDYLLANGATTGSLGIYMEQQHPNTRIPQTIWTFDSQGDDTFLIYMTDPNSPSYQRPLDVRSDGLTPFLGAVGQSSATQIWAIQLWSDERMRLVNTWYNKSLDINIEGLVNNYPINGLFVSVITDRPGQHWELGDSTPQINFTAKSIVATYTSTFIPPVYTSYLADPRVISTVTVILLATQVSLYLSTLKNEQY